MKLFPNLAGALRTFFGLLQVLIVLFAAIWIFVFTMGPRLQARFSDSPKLMASAGEVVLELAPQAIELQSDTAKPGALKVASLGGPLHVDFLSQDRALVSALRWTMFPSMAVLVVFSWLLCGALRRLCGNISRGDIFTAINLRLIRGVGLTLIGYSIAGALMAVWASRTMNAYLNHHVTVTGIKTVAPVANQTGALHFTLAGGLFPSPDSLVLGCVVLVLTEAFRQGLALKTESELTV